MHSVNRIMKKLSGLLLLLSVFLPPAINGAIPLTYETARSLGMGGTSVAIADDHQALFSNPAGLGLRTESAYALVNGFFARSEDFDKVDSHISALNNQDSAGSRNSNYNNLIEIMGQSGWQSYSNLAYYLGSTGFGMAAYYREAESFAVNNPINPSITAKINKDSLLSGSISRSFNERQNLFKDRAVGWWGATMKFVSRQASQNTYYARDFSALSSSLLRDTNRSGATMDFDLGALWQISNPWKPTFGIFIGNILNSEFSDDIGDLPREFAVGASFRPLTGPPERNDKLLLAIDYRDEGDERTALTKLRLGAELKLSRHFIVQTGIRSGYLTAGAGIVWNDWHFQASTYAEELGQNPGNKEDRRWALSTTWEF